MDTKFPIHFRCNPIIWLFNFFGTIIVIKFVYSGLVDSLEKNWFAGIVAASFIIIFATYQFFCMPISITIENEVVEINWPWWKRRLYRDKVQNIFLKQYWWKTVYLVIQKKHFSLLNWFPMFLSWSWQSGDNLNIASSIEEWWSNGTDFMTNREASLKRIWY